MVCSLDNALDLFDKWKTEGCLVRLLLFGPTMVKGLSFGGMVRIEEASREEVKLSVGPSATLTLSLESCSFDYSEPRELDDAMRRLVEARTDAALWITFPFPLFACFLQPRNTGERKANDPLQPGP